MEVCPTKMTSVLLESKPFRPFKSSEEYLYAMKEDLAEWLQNMYSYLNINVENFMEKLETGVALCEHANAVRLQAIEYVEKKQAKKALMSKSVTGSMAMCIINIADVRYFNTAKAGTFFARDNVSNFINWCRHSLEIMDCLLFESDDLILRKNEKHVILCLLEVARRGAKFGMMAPMLIQMERQIDREIAADNKKLGVSDGQQNQNGLDEDSDSDLEDEGTPLIYGPAPQIITNDLKSLDEMVRDLVEKCTCPTQFPMIRVSEGKYRIGDTKVLIFVRILRNHVMVRVGGGWDTLSHYLDKHDPCRCRSQHRTTQGARLVNKPGAADLHGSHVYYDRQQQAAAAMNGTAPNGIASSNCLGPPMNSLNRSRSRSPSQLYNDRRSVSPNFPRKTLAPPPNRSRSPTPNFTSTHTTKLATNRSPQHKSHAPQVKSKFVTQLTVPPPCDGKPILKTEASLHVNDVDNQSDTTSEMSDEGYRSLGVVQDKSKPTKTSEFGQSSVEDVEDNDPQLYTEDDLNDVGLRKTRYSTIYDGSGESPTRTPPKPRPARERSFVKSSSIERSPKVLPPQHKKSSSGTWNGRIKNRPSISQDTYSPPLPRNALTRRSVSFDRRPSSSATTSPTKGSLKQELLKTVSQTKDDTEMFQKLQNLLKKYDGLTGLESDEEPPHRIRRSSERMSFRSPRKDSRPENNLSKIPAPVGVKQM